MTVDKLIDEVETLGRFESLVQLPVKKDPDWPAWAANATKAEKRFMGKGDTAEDALEKLLDEMK